MIQRVLTHPSPPVRALCADNCNYPRGSCVTGGCRCSCNFAGADCSATLTVIPLSAAPGAPNTAVYNNIGKPSYFGYPSGGACDYPHFGSNPSPSLRSTSTAPDDALLRYCPSPLPLFPQMRTSHWCCPSVPAPLSSPLATRSPVRARAALLMDISRQRDLPFTCKPLRWPHFTRTSAVALLQTLTPCSIWCRRASTLVLA
jgi:hypothetical protein